LDHLETMRIDILEDHGKKEEESSDPVANGCGGITKGKGNTNREGHGERRADRQRVFPVLGIRTVFEAKKCINS